MELILGIDNIIFVSILSDKLPIHQQDKARNQGILLSVVMRISLLLVIGLILKMQQPLLTLFNFSFSGKDFMLLGGGIFLIYKTATELVHKLNPSKHNSFEVQNNVTKVSYGKIVIQITIINLVFSVDTILTAVGLVDSILVMAIAVIGSSILMVLFSKPIVNLINTFPSLKIIAFIFLILIGVYLIIEAFHIELNKGYLYCSMAVCLMSEWLNILHRKQIK